MRASTPTLRRHVLVFAIGMSGAVLVCVGAILFVHHLGQARDRLVDTLQSTARMIAANSSVALAFGNTEEATDVLSSLRHNPLLVSAVLYDLQGRPFVSYGRPL